MCCMPKKAFCTTINGQQVIRAPQVNSTQGNSRELTWGRSELKSLHFHNVHSQRGFRGARFFNCR